MPAPLVLMPVGSHVDPGCEAALQTLENRGYHVWRVRGYSAIDAARNQIATDALAQGYHDLIWIDSDVVFEPDDVEKLREHRLPIVCGLYAKKSRRQFACAFLPNTREVRFGKQGGLIEILYCGFGFVYTHRSLFEIVKDTLRLPECNQRFGKLLVPFFAPLAVQDGDGAWYLSEDYAFCERARQCGIQIIADTTIRLWHVGSYRFSWEDAGGDHARFANYTFHLPDPTKEKDLD